MIIRSGRKWSSISEERNDPAGVLPVRGRTRSIRILNRCRARMFAPEKLSPRKLFILRPCLSARSRIKKKRERKGEKKLRHFWIVLLLMFDNVLHQTSLWETRVERCVQRIESKKGNKICWKFIDYAFVFTIIVEDVLPKKKNNISLNNRIYTQDVEKWMKKERKIESIYRTF